MKCSVDTRPSSPPSSVMTTSTRNPPDWSCDFEGLVRDCGIVLSRFAVNTRSFMHTTGPSSGYAGSSNRHRILLVFLPSFLRENLKRNPIL